MKRLALLLVRAIATFGVAASFTALALILFTGEPPEADDAYVLGIVTGVVVGEILFLTLLGEQFIGKKIGMWIYAACYTFLLAYTLFVMSTAELHGPGLALLIFCASVFFGGLELIVLRRIRLIYLGPIGFVLATAVVALLFATQR